MTDSRKHIVKDAIGKEHEFDYTEASHFGFEILSKNARVLIFIEHNDKEILAKSDLLGSIRNDLELEEPIINQYIPSGKGFVIDIYKKE